MTEPVSLPDLKVHLQLVESETGEDAYLGSLIVAARRFIEKKIDLPIDDDSLTDDDRELIGQAAKLLIGAWYADREGEGAPPAAVMYLLRPITSLAR